MTKRRGFAFLEILLVAAAIMFIFYMINSSKKKNGFNQEEKKELSLESIDTTNYNTTLSTTRQKIKEIEARRFKDIEDASH
jgi:hypothetical protein